MMPKKKPTLYTVDLSNVEKKYSWYTVVTMFNCEESVVRNLRERIEGSELENSISEYYIPMKIFKDENGKVHKQKGSLSNYVFINCLLTPRLWEIVRTTAGVSVILATGGSPIPITDEEIKRMKEQNKIEGFTQEEETEYRERLQKQFYVFDNTTKNAVEEFEKIEPPPTPEEIAAMEELKRKKEGKTKKKTRKKKQEA